MIFAMPPIGVRPPAAPTADGSALVGWIVIGVLVLFGLQFLPSRRAAWARRFVLLSPVGRYLVADVKAIWSLLSPKRRHEARVAEGKRKWEAQIEAERAKFNDIVQDLER